MISAIFIAVGAVVACYGLLSMLRHERAAIGIYRHYNSFEPLFHRGPAILRWQFRPTMQQAGALAWIRDGGMLLAGILMIAYAVAGTWGEQPVVHDSGDLAVGTIVLAAGVFLLVTRRKHAADALKLVQRQREIYPTQPWESPPELRQMEAGPIIGGIIGVMVGVFFMLRGVGWV